MSTVWKSQDGDICIMERPTSKFLYMHVKRPDTGKWVMKSSKRATVEAACLTSAPMEQINGIA